MSKQPSVEWTKKMAEKEDQCESICAGSHTIEEIKDKKLKITEPQRKTLIALGQAESNGGLIPGSGHEGFILPGKYQAQLFSLERDELVKGDMVASLLRYGTLTSEGYHEFKRGYQITQKGVNLIATGDPDTKAKASQRNDVFGKPKRKK